jgi:hypothetical protein
MDAVRSSETSTNSNLSRRRHMADNITLHSQRRKELQSQKFEDTQQFRLIKYKNKTISGRLYKS